MKDHLNPRWRIYDLRWANVWTGQRLFLQHAKQTLMCSENGLWFLTVWIVTPLREIGIEMNEKKRKHFFISPNKCILYYNRIVCKLIVENVGKSLISSSDNLPIILMDLLLKRISFILPSFVFSPNILKAVCYYMYYIHYKYVFGLCPVVMVLQFQSNHILLITKKNIFFLLWLRKSTTRERDDKSFPALFSRANVSK